LARFCRDIGRYSGFVAGVLRPPLIFRSSDLFGRTSRLRTARSVCNSENRRKVFNFGSFFPFPAYPLKHKRHPA
jgi:hypothetical protein